MKGVCAFTGLLAVAIAALPCSIGGAGGSGGSSMNSSSTNNDLFLMQLHLSLAKSDVRAINGNTDLPTNLSRNVTLLPLQRDANNDKVSFTRTENIVAQAEIQGSGSQPCLEKFQEKREEEQSKNHTQGEVPSLIKEQIHASESSALSMYLIGSVCAFMGLLHLMNWPYGHVKETTLKTMNMTCSIFVAVLIYQALQAVMLAIFEPGLEAKVVCELTLFLILYFGDNVMFFLFMTGDKTGLIATTEIFAHLAGFAAMYGFSDLQGIPFFEELGARGILLVICIAIVVLINLARLAEGIMKRMALLDGIVDEHEKLWMELCQEADDDIFCLAISWLIAGLVKFLIRGKNYSYEPGHVGPVTPLECSYLYGFATICCSLVIAGALLSAHDDHFRKLLRMYIDLEELMCLTTAWSWLFFQEWLLEVTFWHHSVVGGYLIIACIVTYSSFFCVIVLNFTITRVKGNRMWKRAVRSLELALGVLIGFSWERAFDVAFDYIASTVQEGQSRVFSCLVILLLSGVVFAVVAPAWRFYILPGAHAVDESES